MDLNILIVDDHPMIVDSYVQLISNENFQNNKVSFITASNCEEAHTAILSILNDKKSLDLAILDYNLPPYELLNIRNGNDLAKLIRENIKNCKIIILTMHTENLIIDSIIKFVNPEGLVCKNDIDSASFPFLCKNILQGQIFKSKIIMESQQSFFKNKFNWDIYDNEILILISKGIKSKNLPNYIPLSLSAIEKRKSKIKDQILDSKRDDKELIIKALQLGIL